MDTYNTIGYVCKSDKNMYINDGVKCKETNEEEYVMWLIIRQFKQTIIFASLFMLFLSSFAFAYELHMFGFADPTDI